MPDCRGEGEEALCDAGADTGMGASAVLFEVELPFEGVIDRFDHLPQRFEEAASRTLRLALAGRPQQV